MYLMIQIEKSVQSKLQMAEFNKRFSWMTRTMWATNLVLTQRIYSMVGRFACKIMQSPKKISTMKFVEANLPPELSTRSRMVYKQRIKVNGLAS